jgi:hypothetical protein
MKTINRKLGEKSNTPKTQAPQKKSNSNLNHFQALSQKEKIYQGPLNN